MYCTLWTHINAKPHDVLYLEWFTCFTFCSLYLAVAGPRSAVGRASDSEVRGPGFDTRSGYILSFLLQLIQEGQLSVTGESMCTEY